MFLVVFTLFLLENVCTDDDGQVSYKGFQVWQANLQNNNLSSEFETKISTQGNEDILSRDVTNIDFLLNGSDTDYWREFLRSQNVSYRILLDDVQGAIDKEAAMNNNTDSRRELNWFSFAKLGDIYAYLKKVANANPKYCKLETIGKTAYNRDIQMLIISDGKRSNRDVLIEAGAHAREWVSISSLLYFIEQIAWNFNKHPAYVTNHNWYIIPVLNPDGYEYSTIKDRMWKKNRARFSGPCDGVDINKNFDSDWCQKGASGDICSPYYCGPHVFSEKETKALTGLVQRAPFVSYISIHSYGNYILVPFGANTEPTKDRTMHLRVTKQMADAMYVERHQRFKYGTIRMLGVDGASGMSIDWMYKQQIIHSYFIQTRGAGGLSYLLDPNEIIPAGKEITAGLMKLAQIV